MTIDEAKIKIEELACYARTKGWDDEYTEAVNMAIKALDQQPTDAVDRVTIKEYLESFEVAQPKMGSSSENPNKWIPITSRPMTEEEKEHYKIHPDYQDDCRIFSCKQPDDGQEVIISVCGGAEVDTFAKDGNDGCYFEGRDIDDVDAWMQLPEQYQPEIPTGAEGEREVMSRKEENKETINIIAERSSIILTGTHEDVTRFYLSSISSILTDISTSLAIIADSMSSQTGSESEDKHEK